MAFSILTTFSSLSSWIWKATAYSLELVSHRDVRLTFVLSSYALKEPHGKMDYAEFWEKFGALWTIRPDVEGAALIDNDGTFLKQTGFGRREQRKILASCCVAIVSIAHNLISTTHQHNSDWIYIGTERGFVIFVPVTDQFFLTLLVRKEANLGVLRETLCQLTGPRTFSG